MLPKPITLALGAVAAVIGYSIWETNRPTGDKARVGDVVTVRGGASADGPAFQLRVTSANVTALFGLPPDAPDAVGGVPLPAIQVLRSQVVAIERDGRQFT